MPEACPWFIANKCLLINKNNPSCPDDYRKCEAYTPPCLYCIYCVNNEGEFLCHRYGDPIEPLQPSCPYFKPKSKQEDNPLTRFRKEYEEYRQTVELYRVRRKF